MPEHKYENMKELTKEEYVAFIMAADRIVQERTLEFHAFSGEYGYATIVEKAGIQYQLSDGMWYENRKPAYNYGIRTLHKSGGQEGDGI